MVDQYIFSGSLPENASTYVTRDADAQLYEGLKAGKFCYVLNSRQSGKSSLRVRTMQRLREDGVQCAAVDLSAGGIQNVPPEQWYADLIDTLIDSFGLDVDFGDWWSENQLNTLITRFRKFLEEILLVEVRENIVIFIDEIDSVLSLNFPTDDFFALIRACYNKRVDNPEYNRLTFCFLGVASPAILIQDKQRTPFNIGQAISLKGFQLHETEPIEKGLRSKFSNSQAIMQDILHWTGGQPFLTQKLCQFMVEESEKPNPRSVEQVVRSRIIENWKLQDEPEHLRTRCDRILHNQLKASSLLGIYQKILINEEVFVNDSPEEIELQLSGLVVKQDSKLKVYNKIYQAVFNQDWVELELNKLRPYAENFQAWLNSKCQDKSRLLRGQALEEALKWRIGKNLSLQDNDFITASQEQEKSDIQKQLELEKAKNYLTKENEIKNSQLVQERQKLEYQKQKTQWIIVSACIIVISLIAGFQWREADKGQIQVLITSSKEKFTYNKYTFDALIDALKARHKFKNSIWLWLQNDKQLQTQVMEALSNAVYGVRESNRLEGHQDLIEEVTFSPNGNLIATASYDKKVKIWNLNGKQFNFQLEHEREVTSISFSPDSQYIVTASFSGTAIIWNLEGKRLHTLAHGNQPLQSVRFSPNDNLIATAGDDGQVKLWTLDGRYRKTLNDNSKDRIYAINFSPNGNLIAAACENGIIKIWDIKGGKPHIFKENKKIIRSIAFSSDSNNIAAAVDKEVIFWDINKKSKISITLSHNNIVRDVIFSVDANHILTADDNGVIYLWLWNRQNRQKRLLDIFKGHKDRVNSISFNKNRNLVASASNDKTVKLWQINNPWFTVLNKHNDQIFGVDISSDNKIIATASNDKNVYLWNLQGKKFAVLGEKEGHNSYVNSVKFSPDNRIIVTGGFDNKVKLWDWQTQKVKTLKACGKVTSVSFSLDNRTIASACKNKIEIWDREGKLINSKEIAESYLNISQVSFSPNKKTIASVVLQNENIKLWDIELNNLQILNKKSLDIPVYNVKFSLNNQIIATANGDDTAKLWNRKNGELLKVLSSHNGGVKGLDISNNDQIIATGSVDSTSKIWTINGDLITTLRGHQGSVNAVKFSSDNRWLATVSSDSTGVLWDINNLSIDEFTKRGCSWLSNFLENNYQKQEILDNFCK